jgi:hypothetical protein
MVGADKLMANPQWGKDRITLSWAKPPEQEIVPYLLNVFGVEAVADLHKQIDSLTNEITAWMSANAKWDDRTGDARRSLKANVRRISNAYLTLALFYDDKNVDYDIFLENMSGGKFSILMPTLEHWLPRLEDLIGNWVYQRGQARARGVAKIGQTVR